MIAWRAAMQRVLTPSLAFEEEAPLHPSAAARTADLPALAVLGDHRHVETAKRLHVGRDSPLAVDHHHDFALGDERRHHVLDPRVELARDAIDFAEQLCALFQRHLERRALELVERMTRDRAANLHRRGCVAAAMRDRAGGFGRQAHAVDRNFVGVGVAGAVFGAHAHADAVAQALAGVVDDRVFQTEPFGAPVLEVEIGIVGLALQRGAQRSLRARSRSSRSGSERICQAESIRWPSRTPAMLR